MDTMVFCHKCMVDEMIDFGDLEDWRCPKCNQGEGMMKEDQIERLLTTMEDINHNMNRIGNLLLDMLDKLHEISDAIGTLPLRDISDAINNINR